jgi:uncharacterized UPF0160 family protein
LYFLPHQSWLPARAIVQAALAAKTTVHSSGQILVFNDYTQWQEHLFYLEKDAETAALAAGEAAPNKTLYVLYQDYGKKWRVQAVVGGASALVTFIYVLFRVAP